MSKSINNGGANAKTGKRAWSGHKSDFGDVLPGLVILF